MIHGPRTNDSDPQRDEMSTPLLEALVSEAFLSRATSLARKGEYAAAESLLKKFLESESESPRALDLLARIHAQQGRFSEAEAFWIRALHIEPNNDSYLAGLKRIAQMRSRPLWTTLLLPMAVGFIAIALVCIARFAVRSQIRYLRGALLREAAMERPIAGLQDNNPTVAVKQLLSGITVGLEGTSVKVEQGRIVILFDEGLFLSGASLKPDAQIILSNLAKRLRPHDSNICIRVVGYTDNIPVRKGGVYTDNDDLGLARAVAAARRLSSAMGLPLSRFVLESHGESNPPYPNDTAANRLRNRTVVIHISLAEEYRP